MEMNTWFGRVDLESGRLEWSGGVEEMAESLLQDGCISPPPQTDLRSLALDSGFVTSDGEYDRLLRETSIALVKKKLERASSSEAEALQMMAALDDLNDTVNLLDERLYEWSRLHTDRRVRGEALAQLLLDQEGIGVLASTVQSLRRSRDALQQDLEQTMFQVAPNLSLLAGPILAARLIARAGGQKRLSEMPASTIQLMGAEKSLFKHLKGRAPSPKHGLIYRHPAVAAARRSMKGKVSRSLAGKLAIAARVDYHSGTSLPGLKESWDKRLMDLSRIHRRRV
ncbi:MAG: NOP58 family protein [Methanosarcinales archaeon]|nr:NOP58 family protein [Methanosarcinales archaeon]